MKETQFVSADEMETLEQYGACLLTGMVSLKTLESFHIQGIKKGILGQDEMEAAKTICWEIRRTLGLYQTQLQNILDKTEIDGDQVMRDFKAQSLTKAKEFIKKAEKKSGTKTKPGKSSDAIGKRAKRVQKSPRKGKNPV